MERGSHERFIKVLGTNRLLYQVTKRINNHISTPENMDTATQAHGTLDKVVGQRPIYSSRDSAYLIENADRMKVAEAISEEFRTAREAARVTHEALWSAMLELMPYGIERSHQSEENPEHGGELEHWVSVLNSISCRGVTFVSEYIHPRAPQRCYRGEFGRITQPRPGRPDWKDPITLILTTKDYPNISINPEFLYRIGERFGKRLTQIQI
jgi:hypothetical protein